MIRHLCSRVALLGLTITFLVTPFPGQANLESALHAAAPDFSQVPGTVIAHAPKSSQVYIGSPGIAILKEGVYLAKFDEFGPGTAEHKSAVTQLFRSEDRGKTWKHAARIDGLFWASLFTHKRALYLLGTKRHHGRIVVMRSDDGGTTWTDPSKLGGRN